MTMRIAVIFGQSTACQTTMMRALICLGMQDDELVGKFHFYKANAQEPSILW
jgi:hypothetical protein